MIVGGDLGVSLPLAVFGNQHNDDDDDNDDDDVNRT